MWTRGWRERVWADLGRPWDLLVVGGGLTGAGILAEAAQAGLRALLVEQRDFGWGTSSRSSKLVHGGLRYLRQAQLGLVRAALREREHLLRERPGLVEPLGFLSAARAGHRTAGALIGAGLGLYDALAGRRTHRWHAAGEFRLLAPHVAPGGLLGGFRYEDARTDDARLTLRVLREALAAGGTALSYARVEGLLTARGRACGVRLRDCASGRSAEVQARAVINATGAWADRLRGQVGAAPRLRPLRGSHLLFPGWRFPLAQAVMFPHPRDRRPIFVLPWEGAALAGTTDLDHREDLDSEPAIGADEVEYLLAGLRSEFPGLALEAGDVLSCFAGVRPVVGVLGAAPSRESRDHVVWDESGLLTVTGGKLTTFRLIARDALRALRGRLPGRGSERQGGGARPPGAQAPLARLDAESARRLLGRHGPEAQALVASAGAGELSPIGATPALWAELRWAARAEGVVHLDDLLLRRVRLGLLLPQGGARELPRVRAICQAELGWDDARWSAEEADYRALWRRCYSLPGDGTGAAAA